MDHAAPIPCADVGISPSEQVGAALVRVGSGQFDRITMALSDPIDQDAGIHEARKAIKRLRALLRLTRQHLGEESFRHNDAALRDLGRVLAPLREVAATIDTVQALVPGRCPELQDLLSGRHRSVMEAARPGSALHRELADRIKAARLDWRAGFAMLPDGFGSLADGLAATYRQGRRRMRRAAMDSGEELFHEWRKVVKYLRYQMESIRPAPPDGPDPRTAVLDDLGEILGLEHDVSILVSIVERGGACPSDSPDLLPILGSRRESLRRKAKRLGKQVYATGRGEFVAEVQAEWDAARRGLAGLGGPRR